MSYDRTIEAYDAAAPVLAERYDALPAGQVLAPVRDLLPSTGLVLDVGAGSGRDARWLRELGFDVVAAEPAAGLRERAARDGADDIRWIDDRLPALDRVHRLSLSFDLILLSAVWQHVAPDDRPRAFRKLVTLMRPGGVMVLTLRAGPVPHDRPMFETSAGEVEALARAQGMEILKIVQSGDLQGRADIAWTTIALRMPDDGTGALPLVRGIVLGDDKSSTYKIGLLRAVARIAELTPAAVRAAPGRDDAVELPLGLVALMWVRLYLPLVRLGLPQAPKNSGPDGLGFAKAGFRALLEDRVDAADLRVGVTIAGARAASMVSALSEAAATIANMPANFTRFPNSERRVFEALRARTGRRSAGELDLDLLWNWGALVVPGHLWRALCRYGVWIEPMLVAEWARLMRGYAERMGLAVPAGSAEAALEWREPVRSTAIARLVARRMEEVGQELRCVWTGRRLIGDKLDIDHCLPWSAWPCGDLWNLAPCDPRVNQHQKRDRLPTAGLLAQSRERLMTWWEHGYLRDEALAARFMREARAALPIEQGDGAGDVFAALDWRRLRLLQDQRVPEWAG